MTEDHSVPVVIQIQASLECPLLTPTGRSGGTSCSTTVKRGDAVALGQTDWHMYNTDWLRRTSDTACGFWFLLTLIDLETVFREKSAPLLQLLGSDESGHELSHGTSPGSTRSRLKKTFAAVRLSPLSCLQSHTPRQLFCKDEVACQIRRSRFHWRWVYARVGAEKLGGRSCPNRGPTASTVSHCPAIVSSHAGSATNCGSLVSATVCKMISTRIHRSHHQQTNQKCRGREYTQTENVADAIVRRCTTMTKVFWIPTRMPVPKQL